MEDADLKERILQILDICLNDTTNAQTQRSDTKYIGVGKRIKDKVNSQKLFYKIAKASKADKSRNI